MFEHTGIDCSSWRYGNSLRVYDRGRHFVRNHSSGGESLGGRFCNGGRSVNRRLRVVGSMRVRTSDGWRWKDPRRR